MGQILHKQEILYQRQTSQDLFIIFPSPVRKEISNISEALDSAFWVSMSQTETNGWLEGPGWESSSETNIGTISDVS